MMQFIHKVILSALAVSFIMSSIASAQPTKGVINCGLVMATNCTGSTGMRVCTYRRNIGTGAAMATTCATAMSNNANCSITMAGTSIQTFNAVQTGPNPSCQWSCSACPTVTIDTIDGLPVELLGFEINDAEDGDTAGDEAYGGDETGQSD